jgi:hypothetical protein
MAKEDCLRPTDNYTLTTLFFNFQIKLTANGPSQICLRSKSMIQLPPKAKCRPLMEEREYHMIFGISSWISAFSWISIGQHMMTIMKSIYWDGIMAISFPIVVFSRRLRVNNPPGAARRGVAKIGIKSNTIMAVREEYDVSLPSMWSMGMGE